MDADDELFGALDGIAGTARLLVACGFDGALAAPTDDPSDARAEQGSSGALNVLVACSDTVVVVVSGRPADEVSELMFLSGAKGGLRVLRPEELPELREELGATGLVAVGAGEPVVGAARPGDIVVGVDGEPGAYEVEDVDDVAGLLEELANLRRA